MKSKTKNLLKWVPSVVAALVIVTGACLKLAAFLPLVEIFAKTGLLPYMKMLGFAELMFVALFLWDRSMKLGFYLLTAYFGGAMAIELSHGSFFTAPAIILTIVWIAAYLRNVSIFGAAQKPDAYTA